MLESIFPSEVTGNAARITVTGTQSVQVEQHRGLVCYRAEEAAFRTADGMVRITGQQLDLRAYTAEEAMVTGVFECLSFSGNGGGRP